MGRTVFLRAKTCDILDNKKAMIDIRCQSWLALSQNPVLTIHKMLTIFNLQNHPSYLSTFEYDEENAGCVFFNNVTLMSVLGSRNQYVTSLI